MEAEGRRVKGELPKGWTYVKMLDIIDYQGGSQPPKKDFVYEPQDGYVRLLQIRDFGDDPFPTYVPDTNKLKKVTKDDLLLARYGGNSSSDSLGRICTGLDGAYNVALVKLLFSRQHLDKNYVKYLFIGDWFTKVISLNSRSCQTGFNRSDLEEVIFPLAPLNEQKRIVAKLEKLLAKVNESSDRLSRIPTILKRFRQSVLAAACSGRLTADWRKQHPDVETAEELLTKFRASKEYIKSRVKDELPIPFELPNTWQWINLIEGCESITDGDHQPPPKQSEGVPFLVISNIKESFLDFSDTRFVSKEYYDKIKNTRKPIKGDILYSVVGSYGIPVIVNVDVPFCFQRHIALLRVNTLLINTFLLYILKSRLVLDQATAVATGSAQITVTLTGLRKIKIPLPPLEEQKEIVTRVEALFRKCDLIEQRYLKAKAYTDKLTQSILAKVFRGELVSQDPKDEPAEVLLERIKIEKALTEKSNKSKKINISP